MLHVRCRRAATMIATLAMSALAACRVHSRPLPPSAPPLPSPATTAERTQYRETSTDSDVTAFLSRLARSAGRIDSAGRHDTTLSSGPLELAAYDSSTAGPLIPFVIASRPAASSPAEAHRQGRPVVLIEAGATSARDGTDAVLALLREMLQAPPSIPNALDSVLLVVVPLASPDDAHPDTTTPPPVHAAPDSDMVIAARRETRTTFAIIHAWHPDVVIDLRDADGGGAGYPLTLAPPRHPAAFFAEAYTTNVLVPALSRMLADRDHIETFTCGGCDHRARELTNYAGLRNRIGLLARTNASDSLSARVSIATAFLREALSLIASRRAEILMRTAAADSSVQAWGFDPDSSPDIPLRETALHRRLPIAYVLDGADTATVRLLERHGIVVQRHLSALRIEIIERFMIDSATVDSTMHDADHPARIFGHWLRVISTASLPAGTYTVSTAQPLGVLAMCLLEPESDDGFVTWHHFDAALHAGGPYPVAKLIY